MPPSPPTRSVAVGSSVVTVGVPGGTLIMGVPAEPVDPRELEEALAHEDEDQRTIGQIVEGSMMTASEATKRVEQAEDLFSAALAGTLHDLDDLPARAGLILEVLQRLDKDKEYEEWLRYARAIQGLFLLFKRWMDLLELLRTLLRSGDEVHRAGRAWAQHELGTLQLAGGHSAEAGRLLERARKNREELGDTQGQAASEHGLGVACRRNARAGLSRGRILALAAVAVLLLLAGGVAGAVVGPLGSEREPLSVLVDGAGIVTGAQAAIRCPDQCDAELDRGTRVTLTASARRGSTFARWSGDCGGSRRCRLTMDDARTATARFERTAQAVVVSVERSGDGTGRVTSPSGIDCPGACRTSVERGKSIELEADSDDASTFAGWSGVDCAETRCEFIVRDPVTVTAQFSAAPVEFVLSVTPDGDGSGLVTSLQQPGIDCGEDCEAPFAAGRQIDLVEDADEGSVFAGWSGAGCSGTGACTVPMTQAQTVTARFDLVEPEPTEEPVPGRR